MSAIIHEEYFPDFITITCYNWERLIEREKEKEIIIESFLSQPSLLRIGKQPSKDSA